MKIAIIGWYGTETIGDRAILASLLKLITKTNQDPQIYLGSIYPFFTDRTIFEDRSFIENYCTKSFEIKVFDSRNHFALQKIIKEVDSIIVGGGPLMDLSWMYMIEYAFMKAKKLRKQTALLGCGIGPLYKKEYIKSLKNILKYSDLMIFRDDFSLCAAAKLCTVKTNVMYSIIDPAVFVALFYKNSHKKDISSSYIACNFRKYPEEYKSVNTNNLYHLEEMFSKILKDIANREDLIKLIPMHCFGIGNDDREYLNRLSLLCGLDNIIVENNPLSLEDTLNIFMNARYCIGMRFHSILLQTILNGNNYIIDYTSKSTGKIFGFIQAVNGETFFEKRYINLQEPQNAMFHFSNKIFEISQEKMNCYWNQYIKLLTNFYG